MCNGHIISFRYKVSKLISLYNYLVIFKNIVYEIKSLLVPIKYFEGVIGNIFNNTITKIVMQQIRTIHQISFLQRYIILH
jgi:hypothetical protein